MFLHRRFGLGGKHFEFVLLMGLSLAMPGMGCSGSKPAADQTPSAAAAGAPVQTPASFAVFSPATGATGVCPDTPLKLTFAAEPVIGSGKIRVCDASDNSVVDTIDVTVPTRVKSIGGLPNYNYFPVIITGDEAAIYPSNNAMRYGGKYYVKLDDGVFKDAAGHSLGGVSDARTWRFATKDVGPVLAGTGSRQLVVDQSGGGDFATVQGALDYIPDGNTVPTTVFIRNGTYREIISFTNKHNLTILGEDRWKTVIEYPNNDLFNGNSGGNPFGGARPSARFYSASTRQAAEFRGFGTTRPAAFGAASQRSATRMASTRTASTQGSTTRRTGAVYRRGLLLANHDNDLVIAHLTLHNTTPQGGTQAESIIVNGSQDAHFILTDVDLYSFQDTLQINGQAYISDCYIEGDVDFMWGTGACYFENCYARSLRSRAYYTQIRNPPTNHGYVYKDCVFDAAPGVSGDYLSRIATNRFPASEVVLLNCVLSDSVSPEGWRLDRSTDPADVHYWEYNSHGWDGKPTDMSKRFKYSKELKMPGDKKTIAQYSDPTFVLGGDWTPALAPIITSEPVGSSVTPGSGVSFSVRAAGVPSATYQWRKDGVNILGATGSTYEIKQAAAEDAGSYTLMVSNKAGSTESRIALLIVRHP